MSSCVLIAVPDLTARDDIREIFNIGLPDIEMLTANTGSQCLQLVKKKHPRLTIVDIDLVDIDELNFIKKLRCFTALPIIVLSYVKDEAQIVEALESGADEYCTKPIRQLEFLARVRSQLRRAVEEAPKNIRL